MPRISAAKTIPGDSEPTAPVEETKRDYDEITYIPAHGDSPFTKWNDVSFTANVPVRVKRSQTVLVPTRKETMLADGSVVTRAIETRIPMVELAKTNSRFSVNGAPPAKQVTAQTKLPTDPDQYRGYAIRWIAGSSDAVAMEARWVGEQGMRERIGVNERDLGYLSPFFEARLEELKSGATAQPAMAF